MKEKRTIITDENLAAMMATQTATMAAICELLIRKDVVSREEIVNDLHELLTAGLSESPRGMGPLSHLLSLVDR